MLVVRRLCAKRRINCRPFPGNNPFAVNAEDPKKDPNVAAEGGKLALTWFHRIDDPAITRLMTPQPMRRPPEPPAPAPKPEVWRPGVDWLYRQYVVGVGDRSEAAERALRDVLGAAAGWIDRQVSYEQVAARMVQPAIVPSSVENKKRLGAEMPFADTTNPGLPLKTVPVGVPPV